MLVTRWRTSLIKGRVVDVKVGIEEVLRVVVFVSFLLSPIELLKLPMRLYACSDQPFDNV